MIAYVMGITDRFRRGESTTTDRSWGAIVVAVLFALITGGIAALAMSTVGLSTGAFLAIAVVALWYLSAQPLATAALARGLYLSAFLLILTPIAYYLPMFMGPEAQGSSASAIGTAAGSLLGMLIWGFVFFIVGVGIAGIGYLVDRRARKKLAG